MPFNPIPQPVAQADIDNINTLITDLIAAVSALNTTNVALTKEERRNGVTIGKERKPFSDHYFANKVNYPTLKPSQTVVSEADADRHYFIQDKLSGPVSLITTAAEMLQDFKLNSEHYSFDYASEGRLAAKKGKINGLPGADSWFDALDPLYPQSDGPDPDIP
jgi:hypothetical protein